jgi:hypothetical protein
MARPRDDVFTATRTLDIVQFLTGDATIITTMLITALDEMMAEVRGKMERVGAAPNKASQPNLILSFEAKGGKHHVHENPESGDGDSDGSDVG